MTQELLVTDDGPIRTLTINRPSRRNALTPELTAALADSLGGVADRENVRMVVIRGAGGHFSVGLDLHWISQLGSTPSPTLIEEGLRDFQSVIRSIGQTPVPVVAALEGNVAGFGLDLALACDLRYADTGAVLTSAFARMGLVPDGGSTMTLPRLIGASRAFRILVDGSAVSAAEALKIGMVDAVFAPESLDGALQDLVAALSGSSRGSVAAIKRLIQRGAWVRLQETLTAEGKAQALAMGGEDFRQRLAAFTARSESGNS
jgi:2-(1,2-epoxy-1,2-dihydrophenyl)acetyl-CoA isomerase